MRWVSIQQAWGDKKSYKCYAVSLKGKEYFVDMDVDGRISLILDRKKIGLEGAD
jgi:hypothetical protein